MANQATFPTTMLKWWCLCHTENSQARGGQPDGEEEKGGDDAGLSTHKNENKKIFCLLLLLKR